MPRFGVRVVGLLGGLALLFARPVLVLVGAGTDVAAMIDTPIFQLSGIVLTFGAAGSLFLLVPEVRERVGLPSLSASARVDRKRAWTAWAMRPVAAGSNYVPEEYRTKVLTPVVEEACDFVCLRVRNDSRITSDRATARNAVATVSFFEGDGTPKFQFSGRWAESLQLHMVRGDLSQVPDRIDIPAQSHRTVDIAKKLPAQADAFGFNTESMAASRFEVPTRRLPPGTYFVRIQLFVANAFNRTDWGRLSHDGANTVPTFELVPDPGFGRSNAPFPEMPTANSSTPTGAKDTPEPKATRPPHRVAEAIVGREAAVAQSSTNHDADPPADWTGQFWRGREITPCAWDNYRTTSDENWNEHLETHTDPPTPESAREVSLVPRQWAKEPIHYLGDGTHYFAGVPADPDHTIYVTEKYANELAATGLYALGPVQKQEHALVDAGPPPRCKCGHEAKNTAWFQSHLHTEKAIG
jgi:hypothetical protein